MFTLAMFKRSTVGIIAPYLLTLANIIDPTSLVLPKVAKASTIGTVTCCCCRHYLFKYIANISLYQLAVFLHLQFLQGENQNGEDGRLMSDFMRMNEKYWRNFKISSQVIIKTSNFFIVVMSQVFHQKLNI